MKRLLFLFLILTLGFNDAHSQFFKGFLDAFKKDKTEQSQDKKKKNKDKDGNKTTSVAKKATLVDKINQLNNELPDIKDKPLPEVEGWTLVKSNTIAGFKCDHYEKGNKSLRVFRKSNGDFITLNEDPDGLSREPFSTSNSSSYMYGDTTTNCPIGEYRMTNEEGIIINGNYNDYSIELSFDPTSMYDDMKLTDDKITKKPCRSMKLTFPNGDAVSMEQYDMRSSGMGMNQEERSPINWDNFKSGKRKFAYDYKFRPKWLFLKKDPNKRYPFISGGFIIGSKAYAWDKKTQSILSPISQYIGDKDYPISASDSIVAVLNKTVTTKDDLVPNLNETAEVTILKYANGDSIVFSNSDIYAGKIHRPCGLVTFKKKGERITCRIKYTDGKIFVGRLAGKKPGTDDLVKSSNSLSLLTIDELRPWTGTFEYPDGTIVNVKEGKTDKERAAEQAAKEAEYAKIRKESAEADKQKRIALNNKYGKQYVDIAYAKKIPVVGMPIELVKQFYDVRLWRTETNSQVYKLYDSRFSMNATNYSSYEWRMTLYVRNGKITQITKWW